MPDTSSYAEKRRWQRLPVPVPMFIRGLDEQGKEFLDFSTAINISAGGALLVTRRYLPNASKITVEIPSPALPKHFSAQSAKMRNLKARVISVTASERYHLCGLAFSRPLALQ